MIPSIAIIGRETGEGNEAPVSRPMRAAPHSQSNPMRVAFRRHRELGTYVSASVASGRMCHPLETGKPFDECNPAGKSIHPSVARSADTGALSRCILSAVRLRFKFVRAVSVARHLSALVKFCQEPASGLTQSLKSFSSALFHASKETHGAFEWNEKVFPNLTKVLVKVT